MSTRLGAIRMDGLLTCAIEGCTWSEWQHNPLDVSERGKLTMHWIEDHFDEFDRIAPESAAIIREGQSAQEEDR